jgi:hypothetical protein
MKTKTLLDRTTPDHAAQTLGYLFPDVEDRKASVDALADSVAAAAAAAPASWGVTLKEDLVRLNVGLIEVLSLHPDWIHIILDSRCFPEAVRGYSEVELSFERSPGQKGVFRSVPVSVFCAFPAELASQLFPLVRQSHESLVRAAAETQLNPATRVGYSPAVIDYLSATLGRHFAHPKYYSDVQMVPSRRGR